MGFRAAEIRRFARSLWVQMALNNKLPKVWGDADAASLATYNESMATTVHRTSLMRPQTGRQIWLLLIIILLGATIGYESRTRVLAWSSVPTTWTYQTSIPRQQRN